MQKKGPIIPIIIVLFSLAVAGGVYVMSTSQHTDPTMLAAPAASSNAVVLTGSSAKDAAEATALAHGKAIAKALQAAHN